jgi:hypothetical protein
MLRDSTSRVPERSPAYLASPVGINDPRVPAADAGKLAARLQAATTSGRPVPPYGRSGQAYSTENPKEGSSSVLTRPDNGSQTRPDGRIAPAS